MVPLMALQGANRSFAHDLTGQRLECWCVVFHRARACPVLNVVFCHIDVIGVVVVLVDVFVVVIFRCRHFTTIP